MMLASPTDRHHHSTGTSTARHEASHTKASGEFTFTTAAVPAALSGSHPADGSWQAAKRQNHLPEDGACGGSRAAEPERAHTGVTGGHNHGD
ncbi:hypothetical protein NDU88_005018 [Pleurodeles waltl]|uniref:Uncharacterized protein n=1 Tax=Pleurodeles waltl TaxID=8319 RepID=A0AAV7L346_PLEWA|nr:hypothetical protein NDU88_005018 [Pleurodeles waltl]